MIEEAIDFQVLVLLTGAIIVLTMLIKSGLQRAHVPSLVGYLLLGFLIRMADTRWGLLSGGSHEILQFLAKIGLFTLLFRIGLESNLRGLLKQLRRASLVWVGDVAISGLLGFATAFYLLGLSWITSLTVGTAFTATSVGISVAVWQDADALKTANGELLIDLAELDDISAVVLMSLLFSVLPVLKEISSSSMLPVFAKTAGIFFLKLVAFGGVCFAFSLFLERRVTTFFREFEPAPDPMLTVAGVGIMIAALAGVLGFSLAIGAFFAGLVFSRDPQTVKMESSFMPLYELFSPFFFIGIGLNIDPQSLTSAVGLGAVLAVVAILGKVVADGTPMFIMGGLTSAVLIGVSMVPRAEIAMVIMQRGLSLGEWAVPPRVFGAMVVVCAVTCVLAPVLVRPMLKKWPQG
ncbi:MAG: cation:proton antiporter [Syntrophobacteria bacterium]